MLKMILASVLVAAVLSAFSLDHCACGLHMVRAASFPSSLQNSPSPVIADQTSGDQRQPRMPSMVTASSGEPSAAGPLRRSASTSSTNELPRDEYSSARANKQTSIESIMNIVEGLKDINRPFAVINVTRPIVMAKLLMGLVKDIEWSIFEEVQNVRNQRNSAPNNRWVPSRLRDELQNSDFFLRYD